MPTGQRGRIVALTLLGVVLGGLYLLVAAPLLDFYAQRRDTLEQERMLLPHLEAAAATAPGLRQRLAALNTAARARNVTMGGASDAMASADLQSRIEALAAQAGATIGSTENIPVQTQDGYRRIGLRLVLNGSYETLVKLFATLETATPPLIIDNLQIHGVLRRPGMPERAALDAALEVYGFRGAAEPASEKR